MMDLIWNGIVIGIGATLLMDMWAVILYLVFGQAKPNWDMGGRWFRYIADGKVFHDSIAAAEPYAHERLLGWTGHYVVGILYGIILLLMVGPSWLAAPTFLPAFVWGIVTIGAGWFLMQPGMGLGWAAAKTPNPTKVRIMGLLAHTVFAIGLWGSALIIG